MTASDDRRRTASGAAGRRAGLGDERKMSDTRLKLAEAPVKPCEAGQ